MLSPASGRTSSASRASRSAEFITPHLAGVVVVVLIALSLAVIGVADPLLMKYLFDSLGAHNTHALPIGLAALLGLELCRGGLNARLSVLTTRVRTAVDFTIRDRLLAKLHALPNEHHAGDGVGGLVNKVNQSAAAFVNAFADVGFNMLPAMLYLGLSTLAMWRMDHRLALVVLLFTPLPALIGAWAAREQTARERLLMERWTRVYSRLHETLAGVRTLKVFGMEQAEHTRFLAGQAEGNAIVLRGAQTDAVTGAARGLVAALARITALAVGGVLILHGHLTVGSLVAFLGFISGLFGPVEGLTNVYQTLRKATVALEVIYDILDTKDVLADAPDAEQIERAAGDIRFNQVTFAHRDGAPLLKDLHLHVRPGESVALVGPSGSGKTTLVSLLMRLHALESGSILVDGRDIRSLTAKSLRRQIAFVAQDIHLFNDTVRNNIGYGSPDATPDDIEVAARCANAYDFISELPNGFDTVIGERGGRLSGGQRQRLAIARAILRDAPILVLDEATSALDNVSEAAVTEAIEHLRTGRTTIIVAHRLATVLKADRIVVLKDGGILAEGSHHELLASCEYYAKLVGAAETGSALDDDDDVLLREVA